MSYTVIYRAAPCAMCGTRRHPSVQPYDPTYNLTPIFHLALTGAPMPNEETPEAAVVLFDEKTDSPRGLRALDGKTGRESSSLIAAALQRLNAPAWGPRFEALTPSNGWGTVEDARNVFKNFLEVIESLPDGVWEIR